MAYFVITIATTVILGGLLKALFPESYDVAWGAAVGAFFGVILAIVIVTKFIEPDSSNGNDEDARTKKDVSQP